MSCRHWNNKSYYCKVKDKIINPEESSICEECANYERNKKEKIFCSNCEAEFELTEDRKVWVKDKEFPKCPTCGEVIGIERDDKMLS